MKTLIIGASGLVGGNCLNYFKHQGCETIGTYFSYKTDDTVYFDTLNPENIDNFDIENYSPDVIVHCGALTFVDYCEQHPEESYIKTVVATQNVIEVAKKCKARLVFISTDYIFDGQNGPYDENAPANPLSVYGQHKWDAEQAVRASGIEHIILRVTNIYGDEVRGKNFVSRIFDQAAEGKHLKLLLPKDQYATPIDAADIAKCLYLLLKDGRQGVFNIAGTDYMNRVQLALRILQYFPEATYDLTAIDTATLKQAALRPLQGGLKSCKFLDIYPDYVFGTIDSYVAKKREQLL
jgi:dTDP-4-dehydrorhamnose reductase